MAKAYWLALACILGATTANAAPPFRAELAPGAAMSPPAVSLEGDRVSARGSVCRRAFSAGTPRFVRMDVLGSDGALVGSHTAPVRAMPGYRGGCGHFAISNAPLGVGARVRFTTLRRR